GAGNVEPIENRVMPGGVVGPLADDRIEPLPVIAGDRLVPVIQVRENRPHAPIAAAIADLIEMRQGLTDPPVSFFLGRPAGKLRQPRATGAASAIQIA